MVIFSPAESGRPAFPTTPFPSLSPSLHNVSYHGQRNQEEEDYRGRWEGIDGGPFLYWLCVGGGGRQHSFKGARRMSGLPSLPQHLLWGLKKNKQDTVLRTLTSGTQNPELYIIQDQDCRILDLKVIDYKTVNH